ncbi:hypothetical protein Mgra_00008034 [Meloidogyne graminicola]|uniref:Uncharacterized protein n=1 Tax=Meloidogyne graminicola TaxID=189291 RepID=A0A8S9ZH00_9BILA|nr:hypothetical protein Mgra_00008034 [Meloidogyne graminicola]
MYTIVSLLCLRLFSHNSSTLFLKRQCHTKRIKKVLIANRGEIAVRVIRTARNMGIETVAIYSDADQNSLHASLADSSFRIGPSTSSQSYLNIDKIIQIAKLAKVDSIHPGYGFLSENSHFAQLCASNNIIFIGPPPSAIYDMGMKNKAKQIMIEAGVPVIHGYNGPNQDTEYLFEEAKQIGFPVMMKAVCGGGGKGMRISWSENDFFESLESARSEAQKAFGNTDMILEKFVTRPRHVEVQIFGDLHGNYVYLWERDCSIQRRHQKIIEEAPAPGLTFDTRHWLGSTAVNAASAVNYVGAGTVEFIFDTESKQFYFMEMNTRLQVEHPVTESITNLDLVEWQFRVAAGEPLPMSQKEIPLIGHAIEARIYAEDSRSNFMPTAGFLEYLKFPSNARVDSGIREGDEVTVFYDPMIAKIISTGKTREEAIFKLEKALSQTHIGGLYNNVEFVRCCLKHEKFLSGDLYTDFIRDHQNELLPTEENYSKNPNILMESAIAFLLLDTIPNKIDSSMSSNPFLLLPYFRLNQKPKKTIQLGNNILTVTILGNNHYKIEEELNKLEEEVLISDVNKSKSKTLRPVVQFKIEVVSKECKRWQCKAVKLNDKIAIFGSGHSTWDSIPLDEQIFDSEELSVNTTGDENPKSPMPGIVEKLFVRVGDQVTKNQGLLALNAMKMEFIIRAPFDATVDSINCSIGQSVTKNFCLITLKKTE